MTIWTTKKTNGTAHGRSRASGIVPICRALNGRTGFSGITSAIAFLLLLSAQGAYSASQGYEKEPGLTDSSKREPATAREFYNEGTRYFTQTNLWRAEYNFERALAIQDERMQPAALYNLGHIRFTEGAEELKKGPPGKKTASVGKAVLDETDDAIKSLDQALGPAPAPRYGTADLSSDDTIKQLVASYLKGRGARRDLRAATKLVKLALQAHQNTLLKWERSSGDFKSAVELNRKDEDARYNADVVDRSIAKLIDQIRQLQQMATMMGMKQQELGEKLKQCRGRIPAPNMPPGAAGDDEEDDRFPSGKEPSQEEAGKKDEKEQTGLTAEQAAWLLEAFKLDSDRRLPMTEATRAQQPNDRSRPTW